MASQNGGGAAAVTNKKILASIKDATGASDEDIQFMLTECDGDVNEAVSRILDNPFEQVQTKKDRKKPAREERRDGPPPRGDRRDGQRTMEVRRPGYGGSEGRGDRGGRGGGRGGRGDRDRPGSGRGAPPKTVAVAPKPAAVALLPAQAPSPAEQSAPVPQPPPIRPSATGTSFTDILRGTAPVQPASPVPSAPAPAASPARMSEAAPAAASPLTPMATAPSGGQTFAEKLAASQGAMSSAKTEAPSMTSLPAQLSSYQQSAAPTDSTTTEVPSAASAWGAPGAKPVDPAPIPTSSLAGLLSGKTDEPVMSGATSSAADPLSLQFGQFGMGGAGMGDFGAGFGAGFGDDLSAGTEQVSAPAPAAPKATEPEAAENPAAASFQTAASYGYGQAAANAMGSLGQAPPAPEPVSAPASAAAQASQLPAAPYYGGQAGYQFAGQDFGTYQYGQGPSKAEDPATSAPGAPKYSIPGQRQDPAIGSAQDPATSSAAAVSGGPAAAAPHAQPVVPQMPAYPNHGMPPGMATQYGYMPQYPYMHNANMYMYPHNPYPHYTGGAAYPPQAGNTNFPPSVGSSSYPSQVPSGGPMKYSYPYAQSSQAPPASGLAPRGYSYSNPSGYGTDESGSGAGAGYGKEAKDSLYGTTSNQGAPQMARDSPYAGYNMPGQGYQQQGYNAGAQGQYGNSGYAQYMQTPYALGGQMPPPNMGSQGSSGGQSNTYKLQ